MSRNSRRRIVGEVTRRRSIFCGFALMHYWSVALLVCALGFGGCDKRTEVSSRNSTAASLSSRQTPVIVLDAYSGHLSNNTPNFSQPIFVLYKDGTAIYREEMNSGFDFRVIRLSSNRVKQLLDRLELDRIRDYRGSVLSATTAHDVGRVVLHSFSDDGEDFEITIKGWFPSVGVAQSNGTELPSSLKRALRILDDFADPAAKVWVPEEYEIYMTPWVNSGQQLRDWPADWPRPPSPEGDRQYSLQTIRLPGEEREKLVSIAGTPGEYAPAGVRIGKEAWSVRYRPLFPGEDLWRS